MSARLCPKPLPPWVINGMIFLPEKSFSARKVATGEAMVPPPTGRTYENNVIILEVGNFIFQGRTDTCGDFFFCLFGCLSVIVRVRGYRVISNMSPPAA